MYITETKQAAGHLSGILVLGLILLFPGLPIAAFAGKVEENRVALVVGINDYDVAPLKNAVNDAVGIAEQLQGLGFDTTLLLDEDHAALQSAVEEFSEKLNRADVGLFYYAGHGFQHDGINYLLPASAELTDIDDVIAEAISTFHVLGKMENAGSGTNIMILDACRNNPYKNLFIKEDGLAAMSAFGGSFLAYSTSPGNVAADGSGENGIYTQYLLKYIDTPGIQIEQLFKDVRKNVINETNGSQVPWENSSLIGNFSFFEKADINIHETTSVSQRSDLLFWNSVVTKPSKALYLSYLEKFPHGEFRDIAIKQLMDMGQGLLRIQTNVFGDIIKINGTYRGSSRLDVSLEPGLYSVEIAKKGYKTYLEDIQLTGGETMKLAVKLDLLHAEDESSTNAHVGMEMTDGRRSLAHFENSNSAPIPVLYSEFIDVPDNDLKPVFAEDPAADLAVINRPAAPGIRVEPYSGMRFTKVSAGCFPMGSPVTEEGRLNDENQHTVCLSRDYWISQFEVTQEQWQKVMGNNPSFFKACGRHCPVEKVSWQDTLVFLNRLNQKTGQDFRLPSEAEWEYAARANTTMSNFNGDSVLEGENNVPLLDEIAWYSGNSGVRYKGGKYCEDWNEKQYFDNKRCGTRPVGLKQPNGWKLYDTIGNVWEWTADSYQAHSTKQQTDPVISNGSRLKVVKGGNWSDSLQQSRSAARYAFNDNERQAHVGFRLVIDDL